MKSLKWPKRRFLMIVKPSHFPNCYKLPCWISEMILRISLILLINNWSLRSNLMRRSMLTGRQQSWQLKLSKVLMFHVFSDQALLTLMRSWMLTLSLSTKWTQWDMSASSSQLLLKRLGFCLKFKTS
jgi:hypothetical protein